MQQLFRPSRLAMLVALAAAPAWAQAAYPAYKSGTAYKAGDIVSNVGALYECKEFPYSGWCGASPYHYEPGVGVVWADAWKPYGGEVPPPALGVAVSSPAAGASFNEGASVALAVTLSGPGGISWRRQAGRHGQRLALECQLERRRSGRPYPQGSRAG